MSITLWQYYQNQATEIGRQAFRDVRTLADWSWGSAHIYYPDPA